MARLQDKACIHLWQCFAMQLGEHNVRVNTIRRPTSFSSTLATEHREPELTMN